MPSLSTTSAVRLTILATTLATFFSTPTTSRAQELSSKRNVEVRDYAVPFNERVIRRSIRAPMARTYGSGITSAMDTFEHVSSSDYAATFLPAQGRQKVAVILVDVIEENNDGSTRLIPSLVRSPEEARQMLFGETSSLASAVSTASWGQFVLDGDITNDGQVDIFGPVTLTFKTNQESDTKGEAPDYAGGDTKTEGDLCNGMLSAKTLIDRHLIPDTVSPDSTLSLTLIAPGAAAYSNCSWYAATDVNEHAIIAPLPDASTSDRGRMVNRQAIVHEIGHAIGLDHSHGNAYDYQGSDEMVQLVLQEYGDPTCNMGTGFEFATKHFNVSQSYRLGWLPRESAVEITQSGSYTITLNNAADGPKATLPTSIWIERKVAHKDTSAPGFLIISTGTGDKMTRKVAVKESSSDGPIVRTVTDVPFGLTIHSVPLAFDGGSSNSTFFGRANLGGETDGAAYLEGVSGLEESFEVPHLGVTVKLLKRDGDQSVVLVDVKDMHTVVTELVEKIAPGTMNAVKRVANAHRKRNLSSKEVHAVLKISNLYKRCAGTLDSTNDISAYTYMAAFETRALLKQMQREARKVVQAPPRQRRDLLSTKLKPLALKYITFAAGRSQ